MTRHAMVGLVLSGTIPRVGVEPFFMELITGAEQVLARSGRTVLLLVVPDLEAELATYRRWSAERTVEAVVVVNLTVDDVRPAELAQLGLPVVLAGRHEDVPRFTSVLTDDGGAMARALEVLASLGHRVVGRVSGPGHLVHTRERSAAAAAAARELGIDARLAEADYTAAGGVRAVRELLTARTAPTAVVFDNDVMAVAALQHLTACGVDVPGQVSLLAWDDSVLCEMTTPALSAVSIDVHAHGVHLGEAVLTVLDGAPSRTPPPPFRLALRGSTGPAAAGAAASVRRRLRAHETGLAPVV